MIVTPVLCSDLVDRFQQSLHIQADILEDTIVQHSADLVGRFIAVDIRFGYRRVLIADHCS